jgi:hypothetical protein
MLTFYQSLLISISVLFYSSYDEAYFRMGPWMGAGPIVDDKPRIKAQYYDNK